MGMTLPTPAALTGAEGAAPDARGVDAAGVLFARGAELPVAAPDAAALEFVGVAEVAGGCSLAAPEFVAVEGSDAEPASLLPVQA